VSFLELPFVYIEISGLDRKKKIQDLTNTTKSDVKISLHLNLLEILKKITTKNKKIQTQVCLISILLYKI
jgi:hypothetical protein